MEETKSIFYPCRYILSLCWWRSLIIFRSWTCYKRLQDQEAVTLYRSFLYVWRQWNPFALWNTSSTKFITYIMRNCTTRPLTSRKSSFDFICYLVFYIQLYVAQWNYNIFFLLFSLWNTYTSCWYELKAKPRKSEATWKYRSDHWIFVAL